MPCDGAFQTRDYGTFMMSMVILDSNAIGTSAVLKTVAYDSHAEVGAADGKSKRPRDLAEPLRVIRNSGRGRCLGVDALA